MPIRGWFPTFIYYEPLKRSGLYKFNQDLLEDCYKIRTHDAAGKRWSSKHYLGGYTSYSSISQLHSFSSTFRTLREQIDKHVKRYARHLEFDLKGKEIGMTDCWLNIMPARTVHSSHIHPISLISGTYYVKTPPRCAAIKFEDPRISSFMHAPAKKSSCKRENKLHVDFPARAGNLVLFESWLRHEVPPSDNNDDRVSVSFNYGWW